jgi:hypothetical protein
MAYNRENWAPILAAKLGFERVAPILMTSDPDEWEKKDQLDCSGNGQVWSKHPSRLIHFPIGYSG